MIASFSSDSIAHLSFGVKAPMSTKKLVASSCSCWINAQLLEHHWHMFFYLLGSCKSNIRRIAHANLEMGLQQVASQTSFRIRVEGTHASKALNGGGGSHASSRALKGSRRHASLWTLKGVGGGMHPHEHWREAGGMHQEHWDNRKGEHWLFNHTNPFQPIFNSYFD